TEYWALLRDVTVWDVAVERVVEISGPDALEFTNLMTCRDLTECRVGQCRYVLLISRHGGLVNDPVLLYLDEDRLWLVLADMEAGRPFGIRAIAPSEARRIEAGIFNYGSDMTMHDTPMHVTGLEKYVEFDQEQDFIGRRSLERLAEEGVDRKLVGIHIGGDPL